MRSILNYFSSGLFRKLGQIVAYLIIGFIIMLIFSQKDIKLPKITYKLFGINMVYASETSGYGNAEYIDCSYGINNRGQLDTSNDRCSDWVRFGNEDTFNERRLMYRNNVFITSGSYTWEKNNLYELAVTIAVNPKDYDNFIRHLNRPRFEGGTTTSTSSLSSANITDYTMSYENYADNRYWIKLKFHFVPNVNLKSIWFQINYQIPNNGDLVDDYIDLALYDFQYYRVDYVRYEKSNDNTAIINSILNQTNQINNTINNATDSINSNINEINDTLNNTDIDDDNSTFENFVNNFEVESSGVVSDIVLLPINMISTLINDSSTDDICVNWHNKQICLPNGKLVWSHSSPLLSTFKSFFQMVVGGLLCWKMLRGIVKTIETSLDPTQNGIEVLKL